MKACDQTRLWSLRRTPRLCFFSHSQEQPQRISILWSVILNCMDTPFGITVVLSAVYLCELWSLLPSCACTAISVQNSFIPDTGDSGVSSCSEQDFEYTCILLQGISRKLILPALLHGSTFGVHFWSDVFLSPWLRVEGYPLLTTVAVPYDPFVPLTRTWIVYINCTLNTSLGYIATLQKNLYFYLYNFRL